MNNPKMIYAYRHKETGHRQQRIFLLSEIKAGEDDAHLAILPDYELVSIDCELCVDFGIAAARLYGALDMQGEAYIPDLIAKKSLVDAIEDIKRCFEKWEATQK